MVQYNRFINDVIDHRIINTTYLTLIKSESIPPRARANYIKTNDMHLALTDESAAAAAVSFHPPTGEIQFRSHYKTSIAPNR